MVVIRMVDWHFTLTRIVELMLNGGSWVLDGRMIRLAYSRERLEFRMWFKFIEWEYTYEYSLCLILNKSCILCYGDYDSDFFFCC